MTKEELNKAYVSARALKDHYAGKLQSAEAALSYYAQDLARLRDKLAAAQKVIEAARKVPTKADDLVGYCAAMSAALADYDREVGK